MSNPIGPINTEKDAQPQQVGLKRGLKSRHMSMIAIGGAIGTGVFLGSGNVVSGAGPGGAVLSYVLMGIMVYFLMTSLGEMATAMPVTGSWNTYAARFVDPALGFGIGWNSWFSAVITIPVEISAASILLKFWFPNLPTYVSILCLALIFLLNVISVKLYGESEFWYAGIKVVTIVVFMIVGVLTIVGIMGGHAVGMENWVRGDAPFVGGFSSFMAALVVAGFAFQGSEYVGIAAGESENPERDVPKAINSVFWRIVFFYVGCILIIAWLFPYDNPNLLAASKTNIAMSPFTMLFQRAGLAAAASIINAVLLTSVLSAGSSLMYVSTRMLYAMALEGKAPKLFTRVDSRGIPINALYVSVIVGLISFLTSIYGNSVFIWLINLSGITGFIKWLSISYSHYRFRKAWVAQGHSMDELKYKAKWFPFGPIFTLALCSFVILGQAFTASGAVDWGNLISTYCGIPLFLMTWLGYKFVRHTKIIPLEEVDFSYDDNK
jgi:lysine-specific permease